MRVAFTGPQKISEDDQELVDFELDDLKPFEDVIITGACIGLDAYVARQAHKRGFIVITVVPADRSKVDKDWQEYCSYSVLMPEGSSYRARNLAMVTRCEKLIAFFHHKGRSGELMTANIAKRAGKPVKEVML